MASIFGAWFLLATNALSKHHRIWYLDDTSMVDIMIIITYHSLFSNKYLFSCVFYRLHG